MSRISAPAPEPGDWDYREFRPVPFDRFRSELLALYRPPLRSANTLIKMRQVINLVADLVGPGGTTADLTPALVSRVMEGRPAGERPRTTHTILAYLRAACSYAKSQGYVRTSPFDFRKKWIRPGPALEGKHHSRDQIRRVLELLASEVREREGWPRWRSRRLLALASLFAYTGLRKLEGLRLRAEDVDLPARMILLVERSGRAFKTEASSQPVPIPESLAPVLEDWMAHRLDPHGEWVDQASCPWLFPNVTRSNYWHGGPAGHTPLHQLKYAGERAGVPGFTFLSLRHSYATHAEAWGLSPAMLQRVLRHTSIRTQGHYRHADLDNMRAAVDRIGFGPPAPPNPPAGPDPEGGPTL